MATSAVTPDTWKSLFRDACDIFDDLEQRGFGKAPFSLGGGTVLMLRFKHRLSKDIDLFGYDAQWLALLSPRLNDRAAALASGYSEQANTVKIVTARGDIDFVIAGDVVAAPVVREQTVVEGRAISLDPTSEILAKKLFYRAASFTARDVYDLSAAIDLDPDAAREAVVAAASKSDLLLRRLGELARLGDRELLGAIIPYDGRLPHADAMVRKVAAFIAAGAGHPS